MFLGLRQGATLYILDKSKEPRVVMGYVESITAPRPMYKTYNPAVSFGTNLQTVVDIVVKLDDEKKEFVGIPSTNTVHSYGDFVISETREGMIQEVDAMLQNSKNVVASVNQHESNIRACENILKTLNPVYAKESERDETLDSLTKQVDNMQSVLTRLESIITKQNTNGDVQAI